jgi:hypothetical protein
MHTSINTGIPGEPALIYLLHLPVPIYNQPGYMWQVICIPVKKDFMAKYSKKAQEKVEKVMHERKHGTLKSGRSGKKVTSRKQAMVCQKREKQGRKYRRKKPRERKQRNELNYEL